MPIYAHRFSFKFGKPLGIREISIIYYSNERKVHHFDILRQAEAAFLGDETTIVEHSIMEGFKDEENPKT